MSTTKIVVVGGGPEMRSVRTVSGTVMATYMSLSHDEIAGVAA